VTKIPQKELELFASLDNIEMVFDVGARTDLDMYEIKPDAEYHLFEPNVDFVSTLTGKANHYKQVNKLRGIDEPKIVINPFGLSSSVRTEQYFVETQSCVSKKMGSNEHFHIHLETLDKYVEENNILEIDFLKLDTEGLDYATIMGGQATIKDKVRYIQLEYWDGVAKFVKALPDFVLSLMIEPRLEEVLGKFIKIESDLLPLDKKLISIIDDKVIPLGAGGNIFGTHK